MLKSKKVAEKHEPVADQKKDSKFVPENTCLFCHHDDSLHFEGTYRHCNAPGCTCDALTK